MVIFGTFGTVGTFGTPVAYGTLGTESVLSTLGIISSKFWRKKNKRPPYWNSSSLYDSDRIAVICLLGLFLISFLNFAQMHKDVVCNLKMAATVA